MRFIYVFLIAFLTGCGDSTNSEQTEPNRPQNPFAGKWSMDSSVFINNGIRDVVSAPLLPTSWIFGEDGSYKVQNSITLSGTYSFNNDSLFVNLMSVPNEYEIISHTKNNVHLRSTIIETDSISMKTDAYLTRLN